MHNMLLAERQRSTGRIITDARACEAGRCGMMAQNGVFEHLKRDLRGWDVGYDTKHKAFAVQLQRSCNMLWKNEEYSSYRVGSCIFVKRWEKCPIAILVGLGYIARFFTETGKLIPGSSGRQMLLCASTGFIPSHTAAFHAAPPYYYSDHCINAISNPTDLPAPQTYDGPPLSLSPAEYARRCRRRLLSPDTPIVLDSSGEVVRTRDLPTPRDCTIDNPHPSPMLGTTLLAKLGWRYSYKVYPPQFRYSLLRTRSPQTKIMMEHYKEIGA